MQTKKGKLGNGARFIIAPRSDTPTFALLVLFKAGSRHEPRGLFGAAHFIEHMVFKGTRRRPEAQDISRELDSVGAEFNAFTAKDYTGFYVKSGTQNMALSCDLLSDILWNSKFEAKEMSQEKKVVAEEIKMYEENPLMRIDDFFEQGLYKGSSLGRIISGEKKDVMGYDRAKVLSFHKKMYHPKNALVVAVGNVGEDAQKIIEKSFGKKKGQGRSGCVTKNFKTTQGKPLVSLEKREIEQTQVALGFPAMGMKGSSQYAAKLMSVILGGNMSSRLFLRVREQHGLAYSISSYIKTFEDTGHLAIYGGIDSERVEKALSLIFLELKRIREKGVSQKELDLARNFIKGKTVLALEDSSSAASFIGKQALLADRVLLADDLFNKFDAVSRQEIKKSARTIIRPNRLNLAVIGPFSGKKSFLGSLKKL